MKNFTKSLQNNLCLGLNATFNKKKINILAEKEVKTIYQGQNNFIDIAISDKLNENKILGIEIEILTNKDQIFSNYEQFKNWVHRGKTRKGGLIHLMNKKNSIITDDLIDELLKRHKADLKKDDSFNYKILLFEPANYVESKKTAQIILKDKVFKQSVNDLSNLIFK